MRLIIIIALAFMATVGLARGKAELECQEERGKTNCIDMTDVRVNGDTRAAPMFARGPRDTTATPYTFVANCSNRDVALRDHKGEKFDAGLSSAPLTSRALYDAICRAPNGRKDFKLPQLPAH